MAWSWAFGRRAPLGQNRGGTPIDVRIPKDARPCPVARHEDNLRLSAFRFLLFMAWRSERSGQRKGRHHPFFFGRPLALRASIVAAIAKLGRARTGALIRPRDSGGGGPCEAWWRGRLTPRIVVVERV